MAFWKKFFRSSEKRVSETPEMKRILEGLTGEPGPGEARHRITLCERGLQLVGKDEDQELWATLQREMALRFLDLTDGDRAENVEKAIEALKAALEVRTRERMPVEWARTRSNLANTYSDRIYGDRAENIECTIVGLEEVLEVRTRTVAPIDWAGTQMDLGVAFVNRIKGDHAENIERAISGYEAALEVFSPTKHPFDWAAAQTNLSNALCRRLNGERSKNIERAIEGYMLVLLAEANCGLPPERRPDYVQTQLNLAHAFKERLEGRRSENVEKAIHCCEAALEFLSSDVTPLQWADAQISLANAFLAREQVDRSTNIKRAIDSYTPALDILTPAAAPSLWAMGKINLAMAHLSLDKNSTDNVKQAITLCREVLATVNPSAMPREWGAAQITLAHALVDLRDGDRAKNIEEAISCYEAALGVRLHRQDPLSWAGLHMNLANAHMDRLRGDPTDNRHKAIEYYHEALKVFNHENTPREWAMTHVNLATAYHELMWEHSENLERAIAACEAALQVYNRSDFPRQWAGAQMNLASFLGDSNKPENLERALEINRAILEVWSKAAAPVQWALCQENIAHAYHLKMSGNEAENLDLAETACRAALEVLTAEGLPEAHVKAQGRLGNILFDQRRWEDAANALLQSIHTRDLLYRTAATEEVRHGILFKFGAIEHRLAYALIKTGGTQNLEQAATVLERGWGRSAAEQLVAENLMFDGVTLSDRDDFEQARQEIRYLHSQARNVLLDRTEYLTLAEKLRGANEKFRETIDRVRTYNPNFLEEATWNDICEAAKLTPILYLVVTHVGGYGLLINREGVAQAIALPDLLHEDLVDRTLKYLPALYEDDGLDALDQMLRWLWDSVIGPLSDALDGDKEVLVMAGNMLRLLPLHAAWKVDEQDPAKRRYAIDTLTFRYAPNARSFLTAHQSAKRLTLGKVLAVENPYPSRLPQLPGATAEIESVLKCCEGRVTRLRREEATRAAVIKMLPEFSVLHFACHGRVVPFRPLESGLFLAHDETLSLRDLLSLRLTDVRLAILSACDTAVTDVGLLDESIGLPGGLMIAGADGVIGSLWQLSDVHAMLLMARFYDEWTSKGLEPGEALATAQRWIRAATKNEKHEYFRTNFARPEAEDMQKLIMSLDSNSQHPYFWSSFCYTGV